MASVRRYEELAKRVELFHGLSGSDVEKIFARSKTMNVAKEQVIFHEGTVGNQMFVVLGGKISLYKGKKHLADLREGDMFGEMALVSREPRSATAMAAEDSLIFILDETTFDKLMTKKVSVRMLMNIIRTLCKRLRDTSKRATM